MFRSLCNRLLQPYVMRTGRFAALWRRLCDPTPEDWAAYLKRHGDFQHVGEDCYILSESVFADPPLTWIGNNVFIVGAWLSGHDGSIAMMNRAYGKKLDAVAPVRVLDNVFIGRGTTVLPGVTIGPNAIVGAGSVVTRDVPPNSVAAGNPARVIRALDEHVEMVEARSRAYPWYDLIESREGGWDPELEPELRRQRVAYFFSRDERGG